jgi:alpha-glucosidase
MRSLFTYTLLLPCFTFLLQAQPAPPVELASPDGAIRFTLDDGAFSNAGALGAPQERSLLHYRVTFHGQKLIADSELGLDIQSQTTLGSHLRQITVRTAAADEAWSNPLGKSSTVRNHYNAVCVDYAEDSGEGRHLTIEVRAFNDGVAFRYVLPAQASLPIVRITRERTQFQFTRDATLYPLVLENFNTPYEDEYIRRQISNLHPEWLIGLPLLAELPGTAWLAITEADIDNYPGMYLRPKATSRRCFGPNSRRVPTNLRSRRSSQHPSRLRGVS